MHSLLIGIRVRRVHVARSVAIAARKPSSSPRSSSEAARRCSRQAGARAAAAPSTTTGPSLPSASTTIAIELAKAPLLRATLAKPQRSGVGGRGTSKPRMMSPARERGRIGSRTNVGDRLAARAVRRRRSARWRRAPSGRPASRRPDRRARRCRRSCRDCAPRDRRSGRRRAASGRRTGRASRRPRSRHGWSARRREARLGRLRRCAGARRAG